MGGNDRHAPAFLSDLVPGIHQYPKERDLGSLFRPLKGGGGKGISTKYLFLTA